MDKFKLVSSYKPTGDQPEAIDALVKGILNGDREQTLMGVTGSGKTFTMANIIERINRPTLVLAHNKTLAAQLCSEFREFSLTMLLNTLSAIMIIISLRLMSLLQILILKRILQSMTRLISFAILQHQRFLKEEM